MSRTFNTMPYVRHGRRNERHWCVRPETVKWLKRQASKAERRAAKAEICGWHVRKSLLVIRSNMNWRLS